MEYPEKWLPYVGRLDNSERVKAILAQVEDLYPGLLARQYDVVFSENDDEETLTQVKGKLSAITPYGGLSKEKIAEWEEQSKSGSWPTKTQARLDKLLDLRSAKLE